MKRTRFLWFIVLLALASWGKPAHAFDNRSRLAARTLVKEGVAELDAGRFEAALQKFSEALDVAKVPTVAVWAALANEDLGRLMVASELYESALLMQPNELWVGKTQQRAQQLARTALQALKPRIPGLKIEIASRTEGTDVEVTIDNVKVPNTLLNAMRQLDPGKHVVVAKQGTKAATETVTLEEGKRRKITLTLVETYAAAPASRASPIADQRMGSEQTGNQPFSPDTNATPVANGPATSPSGAGAASRRSAAKTQRTMGWIDVGVGAAGVVVGATTGIIAALVRSSLQSDGCSGNYCVGHSYGDRVDNYNNLRTVSAIGFVVGGVAVATGVTLLLTSPKQDEVPKVSLILSPDRVNLLGSY